MTQWAIEYGRATIKCRPGESEKSAKAAWSSLLKTLNADQEWREYDDGVRTAVDVEAEANCVSCGEAIDLPSEWFPSSGAARSIPGSVVNPWSPTLRIPSTDDKSSQAQDSTGGTGPEEGMACPCCVTGRLRVFGQAVFLEQEGGKQGGEIMFEGARTNDSKLTWDSRLEYHTAHTNYEGVDEFPAKMGYRAGIGCSNDGCWQVRGLSRYADVPAAILAAGALAAAGRSLADQELPDLAALAAGLEADHSKQTKLLKGALKWIDRAKGSKNEELSSESVRRLQRIAAELLDFIKA